MRIIYHCYGGTHSSVLAAAVHAGLLSPDKLPSPDKLLALPLYDKQGGKDYGRIRAYGHDEAGNEIYVLGRRGYFQAPELVLRGLHTAFGLESMPKLIDTATTLNWPMKVGGYLSRGLGLKAIGRLLVTWGSRLAFPKVLALVKSTKKEVPNI